MTRGLLSAGAAASPRPSSPVSTRLRWASAACRSTAALGEQAERSKNDCSRARVCEFILPLHSTYGQVSPAAMKFLDRDARTAAGAGNISNQPSW